MKFRLHRRNGLLLAAIVSSVSAGVAWNHSSSTPAPSWQADESSHELAESDAALKARLQAEALREEISAAEYAELKNKLLKAHSANLPVNPEAIAAHPEAVIASSAEETASDNVASVLPAAESMVMVDEVVRPVQPVALASVMRGSSGFENRVGTFYTASAREAGDHGSSSDSEQVINDNGPQAAPSEVPPVIAGNEPPDQHPGQPNPQTDGKCNGADDKCNQDPNHQSVKKDDAVDVDEPGSLVLFSLGLLGLAARSSRKKSTHG